MDLGKENSANTCISLSGVEYLFAGHSEIIASYSLINSYYLVCIKHPLVLSTHIVYSIYGLVMTNLVSKDIENNKTYSSQITQK